MGSTYGKKLKITIYGESHGKAIGMVAEGFPAGEVIDIDELLAFMARRSAVGKKYSTPRKEPDSPVFLSGMLEQPVEQTAGQPGEDEDGSGQPSGQGCGQKYKILNSPVCVRIENTHQRSGD